MLLDMHRLCVKQSTPPSSSSKCTGLSADPLLALLTDCDAGAASALTYVPVLCSLNAYFVTRNNEAAQLALIQVRTTRAVLLARKTRALGTAWCLLRKQRKTVDADLEAAEVASEQLRVWAATVASAACSNQIRECAFTGLPLLVPPCQLPLLSECVGVRGTMS